MKRVIDASTQRESIFGLSRYRLLHATRQGDTYVLAWVDHHDEAMEWAHHKVFEVNPATGALQIVHVAAVASTPALISEPKGLEAYGLFETFADDDLLRTGLPRPLLPGKCAHSARPKRWKI